MQRSSILTAFILPAFLLILLCAGKAAAQQGQDDKAHIQPRATPTPAASPRGAQPPRQEEPANPPDSGAAGQGATGESSSRDSQIDLKARPSANEPAPSAEDDSVMKPWDPHKAAKDVEVGQYYLKIKNYRAALERFNHALIYKSDDAEATYGLALTQEKLDLLAQAEESYRKYLRILPNGPKSEEARAGIKRIEPHLAVRNSAGSNEDPARIAAHDIDVGETYLSGNSYDAARERFEDAMRLTPDNPLVYFRLAQALQGMQRLDPARMYYRKYLEMEPKGKFVKNAKKAIADINWVLGK